MFLLRNVEKKDVRAVLSLAKELNSYNLPYDPKVIRNVIARSVRSFQGKIPRAKARYLFVIEDRSTKKIFGSSLIVAKQGTSGSPHIYFEKGGATLHFGATRDGPTEIGGLILKKPFRRKKEKFGKQLSWVRFLYMALHPERFERRVLAEFLPPLRKGKSLFWDAVGRRFTGLSYREADHLSVYTKKFIFDLFPKKIRMEHLPRKVRGVVGQVAPQAEGACKMLEGIGFRRTDRVEPFDGGPYYEANRRQITVVRNAKKVRFKEKGAFASKQKRFFLVERKGKVLASVDWKLLRLKRNEWVTYVEF